MPRLPEPNRPEGCLSDLALDRLMAGELSAAPERGAMDAHLTSCGRCARRRDELAAVPEQPIDELWWKAQRPDRRPGRPARRAGRTAMGVGAVVLASAAALALVTRPPRGDLSAPGDTTRTKGAGFALELVVRRADGRVEPVFEGSVLHPGEAVRFVVRGSTAGYVAVVGLDAAGRASVYAPSLPAPSSGGPPASTGALPGSIVLDQTLGDERIVALLCPNPVDDQALTRAGRAALARAANVPGRIERLELPCRQSGLSIRKEPSP